MKTMIFMRIYKSGHINTFIVTQSLCHRTCVVLRMDNGWPNELGSSIEGEVSRSMLLTHVSATHTSVFGRVKSLIHNCAYGVFSLSMSV